MIFPLGISCVLPYGEGDVNGTQKGNWLTIFERGMIVSVPVI